jgi:hypothetical protein
VKVALLVGCGLALAACTDAAPTCPGALVSVRDPATLACSVRKPPSPECPDLELPPWPVCRNECERITDAATCAATAGCHIGWLDCLTFPEECDHPEGFIGCFAVVTIVPPPGACRELVDPEACAARDDCAGVYIKGNTCPGGDPNARLPNGEACLFTFASCTDELSPPR